MSFKHVTCGGTHESVAQARACEKDLPKTKQPKSGGFKPAETWQVEKIQRLLKLHSVPQAYYDSIQDYIANNKLGYAGALRTMDKIKTFPEHESAPAPAKLANPITQEGVYQTPGTGELWRVSFPSGSTDPARLYASLIVIREQPVLAEDGTIIEPAKISYDYAKGAVRKLSPSWLLSREEAARLGKLYGTCVKCGKNLNKPESLARGMGDDCASKQWG